MTDWTPDSRQNRPALQQPAYPEPARAIELSLLIARRIAKPNGRQA